MTYATERIHAILAMKMSAVIREYAALRRAGRKGLKGRCPFPWHYTKTPCFYVTQRAFYCYGCGYGGDVWRFIELIRACSPNEAIEHLESSSHYTARCQRIRDGKATLPPVRGWQKRWAQALEAQAMQPPPNGAGA